ncbi:MAG: 50S ribosomal protein L25 [Candidatus Paceibacterota bacterium]
MFSIKAKARDKGGNLNILRKAGETPAVYYGAKQETTSVSVPTIPFKKIWRDAGESSAIVLSTPLGDVDVLIHDVQVEPITGEPIHVDFLAIDMKKKIKVNVPLEFEGISEAVKNGIGNLVKVLHEVEVEALPKDLPHNLIVDISGLNTLEDTVVVSDIKLPQGVEVTTTGTDVVASIVPQVEEKEEEPVPVDLSAIEVEKKGKKDEEGEEAAEAAPETVENK